MQHALDHFPLTPLPPESSEFTPTPSFNVVIAYEDFETGKRAKRTYDFLVQNLGLDCEFNNQMWKFDVLSIPKLREIAAEDASGADIVVISCHGEELPPPVKSWIETWLHNATEAPLALVALFARPKDAGLPARQVRDYLAEVARRGHMEFFAQPDEWPGRRREGPGPELTEMNRKTLSTLAGAVSQQNPLSRWSLYD